MSILFMIIFGPAALAIFAWSLSKILRGVFEIARGIAALIRACVYLWQSYWIAKQTRRHIRNVMASYR